ncbi:phosphoadenylyl-sulfate reductase [Methyloversatilis sp. XJ19-49]|uniref:phosphoadenylyl-sulfate reductase n=1 Tax=Methyloversatilis sp. XJ19-49 TaxID=2963429 RepID=UPI00211C6CB2|nr:phosphoadenylyl-sulfate reductase [Methyloversatilis sp. XJ19-49]MCQ9379843.1 phosphoadenylyl-sulfate reductase [Methyloversatilis sp. XJ19-49]
MSNPMIHPNVTDALRVKVAEKTTAAIDRLRRAAAEFQPIGFASSMGAEDMLLTDLIQRHDINIEIFTLDTGRLPAETYDLMAKAERHYGAHPAIWFPRHEAVEEYARKHGINAFYDSVELRKACCGMRKVEPLKRALAGKRAWITGMRAQQSTTRADLPLREFDEAHGIEKFNPLSDWTEREVWVYIQTEGVPYNALHEQFFPSIGCQPCTRAISPGEDIRAGRWWWENPESKECGLHVKGD